MLEKYTSDTVVVPKNQSTLQLCSSVLDSQATALAFEVFWIQKGVKCLTCAMFHTSQRKNSILQNFEFNSQGFFPVERCEKVYGAASMALTRIPQLKWRWGPFTFKKYASKKRGIPISGGPLALLAVLSRHICISAIQKFNVNRPRKIENLVHTLKKKIQKLHTKLVFDGLVYAC